MANGYSIVLSQLPLRGLPAGHNLLVLLDPAGNPISQINGLAMSPDGQVKAIGFWPSDEIIVKERKRFDPDPNNPNFYSSNNPQVTIFSGIEADTMNYWAAALAGRDAINARDLNYPPFGVVGANGNSNSVASTLIAAMGFVEPSIPGSAWLAPKQGQMLLAPDVINQIKANNNIPPSLILNSYDSQGSLVAKLQQVLDSNGNLLTSVSTAYIDGIATSSTTGIFSNGSLTSTVSNILDPQGNVLSSTTKQYNANNGNVTSTVNSTFDGNGNLIKSQTVDGGGNITSQKTYDYSPDGNSVTVTNQNSAGVTTQTTTATLDPTNGQPISSIASQYDSGTGDITSSVASSFNSNGDLIASGTKSYDNTGNVTSSVINMYDGDTDNLTQSFTTDGNGAISQITTYQYNADGSLGGSQTLNLPTNGGSGTGGSGGEGAGVEVDVFSSTGFNATIDGNGIITVGSAGDGGNSIDGFFADTYNSEVNGGSDPGDSGGGDPGTDPGTDPVINGHSFILTGDLQVIAGNGNEYIDMSESTGNSTVLAGDGNDSLYGGGGHDVLYGGDGADELQLERMAA